MNEKTALLLNLYHKRMLKAIETKEKALLKVQSLTEHNIKLLKELSICREQHFKQNIFPNIVHNCCSEQNVKPFEENKENSSKIESLNIILVLKQKHNQCLSRLNMAWKLKYNTLQNKMEKLQKSYQLLLNFETELQPSLFTINGLRNEKTGNIRHKRIYSSYASVSVLSSNSNSSEIDFNSEDSDLSNNASMNSISMSLQPPQYLALMIVDRSKTVDFQQKKEKQLEKDSEQQWSSKPPLLGMNSCPIIEIGTASVDSWKTNSDSELFAIDRRSTDDYIDDENEENKCDMNDSNEELMGNHERGLSIASSTLSFMDNMCNNAVFPISSEKLSKISPLCVDEYMKNA